MSLINFHTGIIILLLAAYVQIIEEWQARGLTDTSYKVLALLCAGPAILYQTLPPGTLQWVRYGYGAFSLLAAWLILWKFWAVFGIQIKRIS